MAMGRGMLMYLMQQGDENRMEEPRAERVYNLDGTYNVSVGGGGNRSERGSIRTENAGRQGDPRSGMEETESRYRGKDGRYHAGRRRSEYDGGEMRMGGYDRGDEMRMGGDEEETYEVTIKPEDGYHDWPYMPGMAGGDDERYANYGNDGGDMRKIGFGANMAMEHEKSHGMRQGMASGTGGLKFDKETAEEWVQGMDNEDRMHPHGGRWNAEQLEPLAKKHGIPTSGKRWWEFYAMVNAMYSDYSEVAKKFNITSPDFYALMAKAFMDDKDAEPDKVARYWEYIAKK